MAIRRKRDERESALSNPAPPEYTHMQQDSRAAPAEMRLGMPFELPLDPGLVRATQTPSEALSVCSTVAASDAGLEEYQKFVARANLLSVVVVVCF